MKKIVFAVLTMAYMGNAQAIRVVTPPPHAVKYGKSLSAEKGQRGAEKRVAEGRDKKPSPRADKRHQ